jgi:hypothetical protein
MLNELMSLFGGLSPEQQIETMKYGTNAIGKLGLTIGKVFGYFYEQTHIKKLADAESYKREKLADAKAYEIETVGEAIKREKFLPLIYNSEDGTVSIDISDTTQLMQRSELRLRYSQIQKQHNIESVIGKTALELEGKDANIAEEVDKDWLNRYFNIVEDISDEELQNLWARILAGEILKPKTNSLRLLDFLRNTSREELDILLKVMPFIAEKYIFNELNILSKYGISYELILKLDEWGVLNSSGLTRAKADIEPNQTVNIFENDTLILFAKNESQSKLNFSLPTFNITEIGRSLLRLSRESLNISFIKEIITALTKNYKKIVFSLHSKKGNTINYDDIPIFEIRND